MSHQGAGHTRGTSKTNRKVKPESRSVPQALVTEDTCRFAHLDFGLDSLAICVGQVCVCTEIIHMMNLIRDLPTLSQDLKRLDIKEKKKNIKKETRQARDRTFIWKKIQHMEKQNFILNTSHYRIVSYSTNLLK